ncbi:murein hydrolase activator EnvC family protein [Niallia sp. Krafla_26]|uniref:murein hydrolase activator EnvC family protein n=1 Tax=Niallia sp. Krafla_26 TaxID=3064703 RepID=UPI003D16B14D
MKKRLVTLSVVASLGLGSLYAGGPVSAESLNQLEQQKEKLSGQKTELNQQIDQTTEKIGQKEAERSQVIDEINRIELEMNDVTTKIAEKNQQIDKKNEEIQQLKIELEEIQTRIETRNELLKERARSYQEGGGFVSYLEVLVGAKSFSDFIDRISAVTTIIEADQTLIKEHNADKLALEEKQATIENELVELQKMQKELESLKATLDVQKQEQSNLKAMLDQEIAEAEQVRISAEEEMHIVQNQEAAIQKSIELEKQKQAELEKQAELKRQQEEEAKKREQEASSSQVASSSTASNTSSSTTSNDNQIVKTSSSTFIRPTQGYVTSPFGYRIHPVYGTKKFHSGIDIAKSGTVPVVAAADGVVSYSGQMSGYGNVIIITHSINGKTYQTLYAHLRNLGVGTMTTVSQGQYIAYMGNTGIGTGQHLHFEVHNGRWNSAKSNAINPASVVNF